MAKRAFWKSWSFWASWIAGVPALILCIVMVIDAPIYGRQANLWMGIFGAVTFFVSAAVAVTPILLALGFMVPLDDDSPAPVATTNDDDDDDDDGAVAVADDDDDDDEAVMAVDDDDDFEEDVFDDGADTGAMVDSEHTLEADTSEFLGGGTDEFDAFDDFDDEED